MYIIEYSPPLPREGEMKSKVLEMGKKIKGEGKKKEKKERKGSGKRRGKKKGKKEKRRGERKKRRRKKKSLWDPNHNTLTYQIYYCNRLTIQNGFH